MNNNRGLKSTNLILPYHVHLKTDNNLILIHMTLYKLVSTGNQSHHLCKFENDTVLKFMLQFDNNKRLHSDFLTV